MSHQRPSRSSTTARPRTPISRDTTAPAQRRGRSRVRRRTFDVDSDQAQIHAPLGDGESFESSALVCRALLETIDAVRALTAAATPYSQGIITRVGRDALATLLDPKNGFDHWSGTNDLAGSDIAKRGTFSKRQWQRVKPTLEALGFVSFVHRSVKSGLADLPGVDRDIQISDLYYFSPEKLQPWVREIYTPIIARLERAETVRAARAGVRVKRTPLVKRDRPHRRIPALLNPAGWARALAAEAKARARPYASREAEALAFATKLAEGGWNGPPG